MHAISAVSSLFSLTLAFVSDSFLVEFDHLRALVFVPEWPVLRRNGGSASSAIETVAIRALVRVESVVVVVSLLVSGVFLHDVVTSARIAPLAFFSSIRELSSLLPTTIVSSISFRVSFRISSSRLSVSSRVSVWIDS